MLISQTTPNRTLSPINHSRIISHNTPNRTLSPINHQRNISHNTPTRILHSTPTRHLNSISAAPQPIYNQGVPFRPSGVLQPPIHQGVPLSSPIRASHQMSRSPVQQISPIRSPIRRVSAHSPVRGSVARSPTTQDPVLIEAAQDFGNPKTAQLQVENRT